MKFQESPEQCQLGDAVLLFNSLKLPPFRDGFDPVIFRPIGREAEEIFELRKIPADTGLEFAWVRVR